jgi:hypothetical protein
MREIHKVCKPSYSNHLKQGRKSMLRLSAYISLIALLLYPTKASEPIEKTNPAPSNPTQLEELSQGDIKTLSLNSIETAKFKYILSQLPNRVPPEKITKFEEITKFLTVNQEEIQSITQLEEKLNSKIISLGTYGELDGTNRNPVELQPNPLQKTNPYTNPNLTEQAETLIAEGTQNSISQLISLIGQVEPNPQSLKILKKLQKFPNRDIGLWITLSLPQFPNTPAQEPHLKILYKIAGNHITPEGINSLHNRFQTANINEKQHYQNILTYNKHADTIPALISIIKRTPHSNTPSESLSNAAFLNLALQGHPNGVNFLFEELIKQTEIQNKRNLIRILGAVQNRESCELIIQIAKGKNPEHTTHTAQRLAIAMLQNFPNPESNTALQELTNHTDPVIRNLAHKALENLNKQFQP